jgi:phenylpyruvate tautomerase PptA (4-oxalocrotonate tautomerase family)
MAQIKVYGVDSHLNSIKEQLSEVIHGCVVEALVFPEDKRFHRFFPMREEDMFYPPNRSRAYTIIEIMMIEGRTKDTKKKLIALLFEHIRKELGIQAVDIEILIQDAPAYQFGFRGMSGDEMLLDYKVEI